MCYSRTQSSNLLVATVFSAWIVLGVLPTMLKAQQALPESQELILPIVTTGFVGRAEFPRQAHWESSFMFLNLSNTTQTLELEVFQSDGSLVTEGNFGRTYEVPANGIQDVPIFIQSTIPPPPFPEINGWARLILPSPLQIEAHTDVRLILDLIGTIFTGTHVKAIKPSREFRTFVIDRFIGATNNHRQTAYAIVNPSVTATANVRLVASLTTLVNQKCEATMAVPPRGRVSRFFEEIFGGCNDVKLFRETNLRPIGPLIINSDVPIAVAALDVILPEGRITSLPIEAVEAAR